MKVFISSLITGMEAERAAAKHAIEILGHEATMAENFEARTSSPRVACLTGVREADLVVLILGDRYGQKQDRGISATHEEFREAQERKPILTFVHAEDPEPEQAAFIEEAGEWGGGLLWNPYSSIEELEGLVARGIHRYALAKVTAPLDPGELEARARGMFQEMRRDGGSPVLSLAVAAGPTQSVLRPVEMESEALAGKLQQRAMFGPQPLVDRALGIRAQIDHGALVVYQGELYEDKAKIILAETGDVLLQLPGVRSSGDMGFSAVIEEDIKAQLEAAIGYAAWLLSKIDPDERLTHVVLAARLAGGSAYGWRTSSEHAASPNGGTVSMLGRENERDAPVLLTPAHRPRQALSMAAPNLVEDLLALMRRQWKQG